jgi:hypothetical protein
MVSWIPDDEAPVADESSEDFVSPALTRLAHDTTVRRSGRRRQAKFHHEVASVIETTIPRDIASVLQADRL